MISSLTGVELGCDGRDFEEEGVCSCAVKEDGTFAEEEGVFGEGGREAMLHNSKRVEKEVGECI